MDSYLEIAKRVLGEQRRPLSAKKILEIAYRERLAPTHIYGRTQHKTLQARLSEDIRSRAKQSDFVRTEPGKFFLRSFLMDKDIPENFKREFYSRPRLYELRSFLCLFIEKKGGDVNKYSDLLKRKAFYSLLSAREGKSEFFPVVLFSIFIRDGKILMHRPQSRFRDPIRANRSVGFSEYILPDDVDLFHPRDIGFSRGIERIILNELNGYELAQSPYSINYKLKFLCAKQLSSKHITGGSGLRLNGAFVAFLLVALDHAFEPLARSSAIREMRWVDLFNSQMNIDDLDVVSKIALRVARKKIGSLDWSRDDTAVDAAAPEQFELAGAQDT